MKLSSSAKNIERKIFLYPVLLVVIISSIFSFLIINFVNTYQKEENKSLKIKLVENTKNVAKNQLLQVINEINFVRNNIIPNIKKDVKYKIDEAVKMIDTILEKYPMKSDEELKKLIAIALEDNQFFNGRGYYYLYDYNTNIILMHRIKGSIGTKLPSEAVLHNKKEAFFNIKMINPNKFGDKTKYEKIIYVKRIPELDIVIGTGDYIEEVIKEKKDELLTLISRQKYGKNGYFWIHDQKATLLMHPFRKDKIGKSDIDVVDGKGVKIVKKFISIVKSNKNGAFIDYYWNKPGSKEYIKKIAFVKYIPQWDWAIGTGVYLDDINSLLKKKEKELNKKIDNLFNEVYITIAFIILFTLFISAFLSFRIKKEFNKYKIESKHLNKLLEEKVILRTKELNNLNNLLEEKVKEEIDKNRQNEIKLLEQSKFTQMGEMMGNISHQWRQPLGVISVVSSTLEFKLQQDLFDKKEAIDKLGTLNKNAKYLSDTIEQFSNFVKENRDLKEIIIQERINEVLDIMKDTFIHNQIKIIDNYSNVENIKIKLVLGELSQVLINILNNAKDILIQRNDIKNKWINIGITHNTNIINISIEDNAGGINGEIIDKIFDPYFTTKEKTQGTGIGLYMSRNIIEKNLNGKLNVSNTEFGAKFVIELKHSLED